MLHWPEGLTRPRQGSGAQGLWSSRGRGGHGDASQRRAPAPAFRSLPPLAALSQASSLVLPLPLLFLTSVLKLSSWDKEGHSSFEGSRALFSTLD